MRKIIIVAAISAVLCGCTTTKTRHIEGKGMWANGKTGSVAIGHLDIEAIPEGVVSARFSYDEDTAWLQPQIKTHKVRVTLTGTNALDKIDGIAKAICEAYQSVAPEIVEKNAALSANPLLGQSTLSSVAASAKSLAETKAAIKSAKNAIKGAACADGDCASNADCKDCTSSGVR